MNARAGRDASVLGVPVAERRERWWRGRRLCDQARARADLKPLADDEAAGMGLWELGAEMVRCERVARDTAWWKRIGERDEA